MLLLAVVLVPRGGSPPVEYGLVHYHRDHLGSPQVSTNASGSIVRHMRYDPWGKVLVYGTNLTTAPMRVCGHPGRSNVRTSGTQ